MNHTLITHFDEDAYRKIYKYIADIQGECSRVPYGRVDNSQRYVLDTLPYHLTVSSSKESVDMVLARMSGFTFKPFLLTVNHLGIMTGRENSLCLYFGIVPSESFNQLQLQIYERFHNPRYIPGSMPPHITICISKNHEKVNMIKQNIETHLKPFPIKVCKLGLYEIWPGKMICEY